MNYQSTRGGDMVSAATAIVKGLAPNGGLYVPEYFPKKIGFDALSNRTYQERAKIILSAFLSDFSDAEIDTCVSRAYKAEKFSSDKIAPLRKLNDSLHILELFHGPTCAFKDMALQILPHFLTTAMKKNGIREEVTILVATSGDTGKAALEGFKDVPGTRILVFFPRDGVSRMQRLQMVTQEGENVGVCAVDGNFDDAQNGVKSIFTDDAYNAFLKENGIVLSSANSINWGRLVPQIVYYMSSWATMVDNGDISPNEEINIVVPTGNFGNILAAYYAGKLGVPIGKLICASNANDVLCDFIRTGVYNRNRSFKTTISPSMDILISSNLERFLYDITGKDTDKIKDYMQRLSTEGQYSVDHETLSKMQEILWAGSCDDAITTKTIQKTFDKYGYVADPHTAVALYVYEEYVKETGDDRKTILASTASPYKFGKSVLNAIGCNDIDDDFAVLDAIQEKSGMPIPASLSALQTKNERFSDACAPSAMRDMIQSLLAL